MKKFASLFVVVLVIICSDSVFGESCTSSDEFYSVSE